MNLKELLAAKRAAKSIPVAPVAAPTASPVHDCEDLFILTEEIPIISQENYDLNKYPIPNEELFCAIYTPYLQNPYVFNSINFREYKRWLLSPSLYVLNTFKRLDTAPLLALYMKYNPPTHVGQLHPLTQFLWDIDMMVPEFFQQKFEKIITDWYENNEK